MNIGLALSGGGVRATAYHLGVLERLAESALWDQVRHVSTVSGGTLCAALVFGRTGKKWPDASAFVNDVVPAVRDLLTSVDLQRAYIRRSLRPWLLLRGRAHVLARAMEDLWGIQGCVSEMPLEPRWTINTTCYETGKNWRFSAKRMGDYVSRYVLNPVFPLADAVAASAAVPGLVGPLIIDAGQFQWHSVGNDGRSTGQVQPNFDTYHLWDGGVYENQGLEALYKAGKGYRYDMDYCLVSDASQPVGSETRSRLPILRHLMPMKRLVYISMDQIRSLRARDVFGFMRENDNGGYLRIGESVATVFKNNEMPMPPGHDMGLSDADVERACLFPTTLRQLNVSEFDLIHRHGYETCNTVLHIGGHHG